MCSDGGNKEQLYVYKYIYFSSLFFSFMYFTTSIASITTTKDTTAVCLLGDSRVSGKGAQAGLRLQGMSTGNRVASAEGLDSALHQTPLHSLSSFRLSTSKHSIRAGVPWRSSGDLSWLLILGPSKSWHIIWPKLNTSDWLLQRPCHVLTDLGGVVQTLLSNARHIDHS